MLADSLILGHMTLVLGAVGTLLGMFVAGGVVGASGFKYVGFIRVVPLALLLLASSLPPLYADFHRTLRRKVKAIQPSS